MICRDSLFRCVIMAVYAVWFVSLNSFLLSHPPYSSIPTFLAPFYPFSPILTQLHYDPLQQLSYNNANAALHDPVVSAFENELREEISGLSKIGNMKLLYASYVCRMPSVCWRYFILFNSRMHDAAVYIGQFKRF